MGSARCLATLALAGLLAGSRPAQGNERQTGQGIADALARCADCHPSEAAGFSSTGMARALGPLREGELHELAPVGEESSGFVYSFEGEGARARLVESRAAPGTAPFRDSLPVAFAIGAGELDRAFAVERGGRLWLAPLEVIGKDGERHAALAPGHAITPGSRFTLPVTPECLGCHTDAALARTWPLNRKPAEFTPRGLSCAACHGAVVEHVRVRSEQLPENAPARADPLAAEASWSRVARMDRCAACHLQGDVRIQLDPELLGPPPPGADLLATRAVFVGREASDAIGFVSHSLRLSRSRCYLESRAFPGGGLACESCHDPHRSAFDPEERARVRRACRDCHEPVHAPPLRASDCALAPERRPEGRDCVDCHLRATGVFDVPDVRIHDHWIRRTIGPPSPAAPLRSRESPAGAWTVFEWPDAPGRFDGEDAGLWTMALAHAGQRDAARAHLARGLGTRARELPMLHHVRGSLLEEAGDLRAARAAYGRALELDPELSEAAVNLGPVLARLGEAAAGKAHLDRLLARAPLADTALRNRAFVHMELGDTAGALTDLEAAMKLLPDATLAQALARIAEQRKDADGARRWNAEARRLDPRLP